MGSGRRHLGQRVRRAALDALAAEQRLRRPSDQLEVEPQRLLLDVLHVELDAVGPREGVATRDLCEARAAGAGSAFYMMLRLPWELKDLFTDWLAVHFPDRAKRVLARLADMRGGPGGQHLNDPRFFTRMKGQGKWAELVRMRFEVASRRLGFGHDRTVLRTDLFRPPGRDGQLGLFPTMADPRCISHVSGPGRGPDEEEP